MMAPLIPLALLYGQAKQKVRDPRINLHLGAYTKRIGLARLLGSLLFAGFGVLFIALAMSGNSDTAPAFQKTIGFWMRELSDYLDNVPNLVSLPVLLALVAGFAYAVIKKGGGARERQG
jgi:hypothetical protein